MKSHHRNLLTVSLLILSLLAPLYGGAKSKVTMGVNAGPAFVIGSFGDDFDYDDDCYYCHHHKHHKKHKHHKHKKYKHHKKHRKHNPDRHHRHHRKHNPNRHH